MAREKLRPEERQRAIKACLPCRDSKKKCDSRSPCSNCRRRNCEALCLYSVATDRHSRSSHTPRRPAVSSVQRMQEATNSSQDASNLFNRPRTTTSNRNAPYTPHSTTSLYADAALERVPTSAASTADSEELAGEMGSPKEDNVNMGDSMSLSFLHFLRRTLRRYMGPSPFTDSRRANVMLKPVIPMDSTSSDTNSHHESQLSTAEKREYLEHFFTATTGIIFLFSPKEFSELLDARSSASVTASDQYTLRDAILDLAIAIGGQCCDTTSKSLYFAQKHFDRADKFAFRGALLSPSVDMICVFILMSIYMLGSCKRNGVFMYLGIAARAAHALDLHVPERYQQLAPGERQFRSQVWMSLRIFDIGVSSVISRPPASALRWPSSDALPWIKHNEESQLPERVATGLNAQVCVILEEIMDYLSQNEEASLPKIEEFLTRLRQWAKSLPEAVRVSSITLRPTLQQRRQALSNFAISCVYYFSVILITRPLLITCSLARLEQSKPSTTTAVPHQAPSAKMEQIARVCVDAAILMTETARRAQLAGVLTQNMCLLTAWLFSASLILGFSIFVETVAPATQSCSEAEAALRGSINVIRELARTSPQAHHYLDVLKELLDAIQKHNEVMLPTERRPSNQYLDHVFVLDHMHASSASMSADHAPFTTSKAPHPGSARAAVQQGAGMAQGASESWGIPHDARHNGRNLPGTIPASISLPIGAFDWDWGSTLLQVNDDSIFEVDPFMDFLETL